MKYTFFALQAAVRDLSVRARLHSLVALTPGEQSLADKRGFYNEVTNLLLPAVACIDMGYWDYIPDASRAEKEFDTWCSEIEQVVGGAVPDEDGPGQGAYRTAGAGGQYFLVSLAFLLQKGGTSDVTMAERCDIQEADFFRRSTFAHLLATPPMLSYASIRADAIYVVPGSDEDALTAEDLRGEGYEYLRPIT